MYYICTFINSGFFCSVKNGYIYEEKNLRPYIPKYLTELSSWFSSRNEFFAIFEFRVERHFFVIFGKFRISKIPKLPKLPNIRNLQKKIGICSISNFPKITKK